MTTCFGKFSNSTVIGVCSGFGNCTTLDKCVCNDNHFGIDCSVVSCFGKFSNSTADVCSGFGNCTSPNVCSCLNGYYGLNCSITSCFGKLSNETSAVGVCSGKGNCISNNKCQCYPNYLGIDCSITTCFGILSNNTPPTTTTTTISNNSSWVCSGRGVCSSFNFCSCNDGYTGNTCSQWTCFGIPFNDSSRVCGVGGVGGGVGGVEGGLGGVRGTCFAYNKCNCSENVFGEDCSLDSCFGVLSNETSKVCSGYGRCVGFNKCNCTNLEIFSGDMCDTTSCFGVSSKVGSVCSGNGKCLNLDKCVCNVGFSGGKCEVSLGLQVVGAVVGSVLGVGGLAGVLILVCCCCCVMGVVGVVGVVGVKRWLRKRRLLNVINNEELIEVGVGGDGYSFTFNEKDFVIKFGDIKIVKGL